MRELVSGLRRAYTMLKRQPLDSSGDYWQQRYARGETSGYGSYGRLAEFKADILNKVVAERSIATVIEFGCGDGAQLSMMRYPSYRGIDVSPAAVAVCQKKFAGDATRTFMTLDDFRTARPTLPIWARPAR